MHRIAGLLTFAAAAAAPVVALAGTGGAVTQQQAANPVPEPAAMALFAAGALIVGGAVRRYRRSS